jgi:ABC-type uncharacterized transport system fused permease/ATPase subunit
MTFIKNSKIFFQYYWRNTDLNAKMKDARIFLSNLFLQAFLYIINNLDDFKSNKAENLESNIMSDVIATQNVTNTTSMMYDFMPSDDTLKDYMPIIRALASNMQNIIHVAVVIRVYSAIQSGISQQILIQNKGRNIGIINAAATPAMTKDVEIIGYHIYDAAQVFNFIADLGNVVAMGSYLRKSYLTLPEARNFILATISVILCANYLDKIVADRRAKASAETTQEYTNWCTRVALNVRHGTSIVFGEYQGVETEKLDHETNALRKSIFKQINAAATAIPIETFIMAGGMEKAIKSAIKLAYPDLPTEQISKFSRNLSGVATTLFATVSNIVRNFSIAKLGLEKFANVQKLFAEIDELLKSTDNAIEYEQHLDDNAVLQLVNFALAIPNLEIKDATLLQKHRAAFESKEAIFVFDEKDFNFKVGSKYRIAGKSGVGKSTFFKGLHGIWPYSEGKIKFACKKTQIYSMPQNQLFFSGTLLENIYYPDPVAPVFEGSAEQEILTKAMHILGLSKEITRLNESKNWDTDLSDGLKKRINFLRIYFRARRMHLNQESDKMPQVLLLDEMTSNVDETNAQFMELLVCEMRQMFPGLCVLFIRHGEAANALADDEELHEEQRAFAKQKAVLETGLHSAAPLTLMYRHRRHVNNSTDNGFKTLPSNHGSKTLPSNQVLKAKLA